MIKLGVPRHVYQSLDSTMDTLNALARAGAPEGTLVVAEEQRAGRGRAGRSWQAPRGTALLCSLLLRPPLPPKDLGALPLIAGVAIAEAVESLVPVQARLKWPNDVFLGGRKVCGVLIQVRTAGDRTEFVNLGIGLNVSASTDELPDGATSIRAESRERSELVAWDSGSTQGAPLPGIIVGEELVSSRGQRTTDGVQRSHLNIAPTISDVERAVMNRLTWHYERFLSGQGHVSIGAWLKRAMFLGAAVRIEQDGANAIGVFTGVNSQGALLLMTEVGVREITAGDLTRGPRPAAVD